MSRSRSNSAAFLTVHGSTARFQLPVHQISLRTKRGSTVLPNGTSRCGTCSSTLLHLMFGPLDAWSVLLSGSVPVLTLYLQIFHLLAGESLIYAHADNEEGNLFRAMLAVTSCSAFPPHPSPSETEWLREWGLTGGALVSFPHPALLLTSSVQRAMCTEIQTGAISFGRDYTTTRSLSAEDCSNANIFILRCLYIDPADRASVKELLEDPWLSV